MDKKEVAAVLEEIALLLDLAGENPFKVRAYETGARAMLTFPGDLAEAWPKDDWPGSRVSASPWPGSLKNW